MNKVALTVAGIAFASATAFGMLVAPEIWMRHRVDRALASLSADSQIYYGGLKYSLFDGTLELTDVSFVAHDSGQTLRGSLAHVSLKGAGETAIDSLHGTGFSVTDDDHTLRIDAETLEGDELFAKGSLEEGDFHASAGRLSLGGVVLTSENGTTQISEIATSRYLQSGSVPHSLALTVHGLKLEQADLQLDETRALLTALGYDSLLLDFELAYDYQILSQRLKVERAAVAGQNMGRLSLSADLGSVPLPDPTAPEESWQAVMAATLERLELRYDDSSLAGRWFKMAAEQQGLSEAEFKADTMARLDRLTGGHGTPLGHEIGTATRTFMDQPQALAVQLTPPKPLPLMMVLVGLNMPQALARAAGLRVVANP